MSAHGFDLVITGGRVIDPETGHDRIANIGIRDGRIVHIDTAEMHGTSNIDATGHVVSPGFIDLHSHAHTRTGLRLQALDGVTTALELELGAHPVRYAYDALAAEGSPLNYGFATSWGAARIAVVDGVGPTSNLPLTNMLASSGRGAWGTAQAAPVVDEVLRHLEEDFAEGALGIGIALGYAPDTDPGEYIAVAALAARLGVPTFTHSRSLAAHGPNSTLAATREIISAAADTGAHMHMCHINSSTHKLADTVLEMWTDGLNRGARITIEGYPYGAGSTAVGASFLSPQGLADMGLTPRSLVHVASGRRINDASELLALRREDPGALVLVEFLDEHDEADRALLFRSLTGLDSAFASDAIAPDTEYPGSDRAEWPPRPSHAHPRGAGCYSRVMRWLVREEGALDLVEAIRRCTLLPAQIMAEASPAMAGKGRLQPGCDADIVIFDPDRITDNADYGDGSRPATGVLALIVHGEPVVLDGELRPEALPGRPVYGRHRA